MYLACMYLYLVGISCVVGFLLTCLALWKVIGRRQKVEGRVVVCQEGRRRKGMWTTEARYYPL
jgi:hypothetical protein